MAQTVALQRGVQSVTYDGTTRYTMFTQSGGIATRVIIGGVSAYSNAARPGMMMGIYVVLNGGGFNFIAFKMGSNAYSIGAMDFCPGTVAANFSSAAGSTNPSTSSIITQSVASFYSGNGDIFSQSLTGSGTGTTPYSDKTYEFCPIQFWIGPGDAVVFKGRMTNTTETGQIAYNFTTITES